MSPNLVASIRHRAVKAANDRMESNMSIEQAPYMKRPLNWRVKEFCYAHGMVRTKFYGLVATGKIKLIKCGKTSLITDAEALRFQAALEAGDI